MHVQSVCMHVCYFVCTLYTSNIKSLRSGHCNQCVEHANDAVRFTVVSVKLLIRNAEVYTACNSSTV